MNEHRSPSSRAAHRFAVPCVVAAVAALLALAVPGAAKEHAPFEAKAGLELASAAALSWAPDAVLIYIENDEPLGSAGSAPRWGYLFHSAERGQGRAYSIHDGGILVAENLPMRFEAPPLGIQWIDSGAALSAAWQAAGHDFCRDHGGELSTMLLMRGAFQDEKNLDSAAWTVIFTSPSAPSLFVMVDAADGRVRRTWRG